MNTFISANYYNIAGKKILINDHVFTFFSTSYISFIFLCTLTFLYNKKKVLSTIN